MFVAGEPGQLERMKSLFAFLRQEQERFDDPLDLTEIYPELAN